MDEPLWTFDEIATALAVPAPATGTSSGVSIDSRTLQPGDIFVAIKGERTNGHSYVTAAFEKGAAAAVVSEEDLGDISGPLFRTSDTLDGLNALARAARSRTDARIVAVTGSVGKTGTKEMLRTMLSACGATHASEKSYNNLWGVPLSLARMPRGVEFGVFEIGMNHAGEITPLTQMVRPHVAMITWVAAVHIEFFNSVAEIADAKAEIFQGLDQGGSAVLPRDNEHFGRLAAHAKAIGAEIVTFGSTAGSDSRILNLHQEHEGSLVDASILGSKVRFFIGAPGRHLASNAVAALSAAKLLGADLSSAAGALEKFEAPEGRGRRVTFESVGGPVLVIDETYNANPASMRAALDVLGAIPRQTHARRIAVMGDMLELGHGGPQFHAELASAVDSNGIDLVFCCGQLMEHLYRELPAQKRGGFASSSEGLRACLLDAIRGGDAVMIKGSLGSKMGLLAEALRSTLESAGSEHSG
jgi:UDP-N-acetylmuramoyl-tripeptide--D-alanyl-D-alanine ligase